MRKRKTPNTTKQLSVSSGHVVSNDYWKACKLLTSPGDNERDAGFRREAYARSSPPRLSREESVRNVRANEGSTWFYRNVVFDLRARSVRQQQQQ